MEILLAIFLNLVITAVAYLLVPAIFCISRKKLTQAKIKKFVIINGAIVWLIFTIIKINADIDQTSAAVFLWSTVAYFILKKCCLDVSENAPKVEEKPESHKNVVKVPVRKAKSHNNLPKNKKKDTPTQTYIIVILVLLLLSSLIFNLTQHITIKRIEAYIDKSFWAYDETDTLCRYEYDYKTHKYLDSHGNEHRE